jgi:hypothetical protein
LLNFFCKNGLFLQRKKKTQKKKKHKNKRKLWNRTFTFINIEGKLQARIKAEIRNLWGKKRSLKFSMRYLKIEAKVNTCNPEVGEAL